MKQQTVTSHAAFAVREPEPDPVRAEPELAEQPEEIDWPETLESVADTSLTVPGQGDRPDKCGTYLPLKYCPDCGEHQMLEHRCKGRRCPACDSLWVADRAEVVTERLQAARLDEEPGVARRLLHVVVSPPESETANTLSAFGRDGKKAYQLAQEHGVRGGVLIPHPFRVKESVKKEYRRGVREGKITTRGLWKWLLEERDGGWRAAVYYSPHYHILGLCADLEPSSPSEDDGWVVKNIDSLEPLGSVTDKESHDDVFSRASYLLSHTGFDPEESGHVLRWFGETAYCNFSTSDALSEGAERALSRTIEEVREEGGGLEGTHDCGDCGEELRPIMEAADQLQDKRWCDEIGREKQRELVAAVEWLRGERHPPPGMRNPASAAAASDVLERMVRD
jgi:hypothetical protein